LHAQPLIRLHVLDEAFETEGFARHALQDAMEFVGEVQGRARRAPLPTADACQGLGLVEQGTVALEFGHVAEGGDDLDRPPVGVELRHRGHR
jgi:hypothetical protein